eukprot:Gb_28593 [translate_table: standard]
MAVFGPMWKLPSGWIFPHWVVSVYLLVPKLVEEVVGFAQVVFWGHSHLPHWGFMHSLIHSLIHLESEKFWHVRGELGGEEKICLLLLEPWSVRRFDCWLVGGEIWNPWRTLEFHLAVGQL